MAVVNYAPELIEFWKIAFQREISIPLADEKEAYRLRIRLYRLRKDLERERHPAWHLAKRASIRLEGNTIIGHPADDQFVEQLRAAGVAALDDGFPAIDLPPTPTGGSEVFHAPLAMEEALAEYKSEKDDP